MPSKRMPSGCEFQRAPPTSPGPTPSPSHKITTRGNLQKYYQCQFFTIREIYSLRNNESEHACVGIVDTPARPANISSFLYNRVATLLTLWKGSLIRWLQPAISAPGHPPPLLLPTRTIACCV